MFSLLGVIEWSSLRIVAFELCERKSIVARHKRRVERDTAKQRQRKLIGVARMKLRILRKGRKMSQVNARVVINTYVEENRLSLAEFGLVDSDLDVAAEHRIAVELHTKGHVDPPALPRETTAVNKPLRNILQTRHEM